ncbi:hypothetical protein BLNAU_3856 [Blattamonas nauphoetae]|uniref:Uncharacterized protein n=1 Tax=Blattamonas nauphoetae TaxID=2049346 RepID=A0ABQ9YBM8_9EUKA|nr:hypothetical protein BLNAU_3856 [Blattamonas nauphoetae]
MTLVPNGTRDSSMPSKQTVANGDLSPRALSCPPTWNQSNSSSLLKRSQNDDEDIIVETLQILQKVASGVSFSCNQRFVVDCFGCVSESGLDDIWALYWIIKRDPPTLTLLPSPIFPSSSPHQQYPGLSFLAALTNKLRIFFSEFQTNLPTDPSHIPQYIQITKNDPFLITRSLTFCSYAFLLPTFLLKTTPPIEVDSKIIRELILFVKEALPTIFTNISNIDTLIASLPSDSSPTTPLASGVDSQMIDSLNLLRDECEDFVRCGWLFFIGVTFRITEPHKSSFQTIILDDPSFPDLILNSLQLNHKGIRAKTLAAICNILTYIVSKMFFPIGGTVDAKLEQDRLNRVYVFEPAQQFIIFMFNNSDILLLNEKDKIQLDDYLCWIHNYINNLELRSDEHETDIVSELVKWEMQTMIEMEKEESFQIVFDSMLNRTQEWNREKRERQKRREVRLREEGWDDAFELRVVGIEVDANQNIQNDARRFRRELAFNADEF